MYFAKNVKYLRKSAGLTQADIARRFNYNAFSTVQKWEAGENAPTLNVAQRLTKMFGVTLDDMANIDLEEAGIKPFHQKSDVMDMADEIIRRPDLFILVEAAKKADPRDVLLTIDLLNRLNSAQDQAPAQTAEPAAQTQAKAE